MSTDEPQQTGQACRQFLATALDQTAEAFLGLDDQGAVIFANHETCSRFGYELEELLTLSLHDLVPELTPRGAKRFLEKVETESHAIMETTFESAQGCLTSVRIHARAVRSDGSLRISCLIERAQNAASFASRMLTRECQLELALEAANVGQWDWDMVRDKMYFNPTWYSMLGYEPDALPPSMDTWSSLVHPDDVTLAIRAFSEHFNSSSNRLETRFRMKRADGSWQWIQNIGMVVERDADQTPMRVVGVLVDIQEAVRDREALNQAKADAEAANRSKDQFLANMSHEIRTPMTAILGYTDILGEDGTSEEQRQEAVEVMRRNGQHLLTVINDILDLSKIEAGRMTMCPEPTHLPGLVDDILLLMEIRARAKELQLGVEYRSAIPEHIRIDPVRLKQILVNLVGNAIKFTEKGEVRVILEATHDPEYPDKPTLTVEVIDSGIGMTPQQQERLFKPFTQADDSMTRRFGGTGLGLTISRKLAHMMNCELSVTSVEGRGSTFTLRGQIETPKQTEWVTEYRPLHFAATDVIKRDHDKPLLGYHILVAEDGLDNQRILRHHLKKAGAEVTIAENGQEAIDAVMDTSAQQGAFDLILMDMQMPVLDGYSATAELRKLNVDLPIIALTAHAMSGDREKCLAAGCTDFQTKPINREALIKAIALRISRSQAA